MSHHSQLLTETIAIKNSKDIDELEKDLKVGFISYKTPDQLNNSAITTEIVSGYVLRFASIQSSDSNAVVDATNDDIYITNGSWYEINGRITIKDNTTDDKNMTAFLFRNEDGMPVKEWYYHFTQGQATYRYFQMALNGYIYLDANKSYKWFITGDGGYIHPDQTEIYLKKLNTDHPSS